MPENALIGYTGFVGGELDRQIPFCARFNSRNIGAIRGMSFDTLYCAGVSAVKWQANRDPEKDLGGMVSLIAALQSVRVKRFILISTVDVYANPCGVDENTFCTLAELHPYGVHRRMLENFIQERFVGAHIVRLPGLFGRGLKKNVIYDLMHDNCLDQMDPEGLFQFYNLEYLAADIEVAVNNRLSLVNFATEPVSVREIALQCFGKALPQSFSSSPPRYDMRTRYAGHYGGRGGYLYSREQVLNDIERFVRSVRTEGKK